MQDDSTEKENNTQFEEFKVKGEDLLGKIREIIKEGNIRRLIIKDKEEKTILEIPLTIGVVGVILAPTFAAIGAVAALITECTIYVEKRV
jgi:hypothetical protein